MRKGTTLAVATVIAGTILGYPAFGLACGPWHGYNADDYRGAPYRGGIGTVLGAVVGGVVGSHFGGHGRPGGIIAGTLLGAVLGHEIGASLDRTDDLRAQRVLENNRADEASAWVNPDTGARVVVTPARTVRTAADEYCREYTTDVKVGEEEHAAHGTACRQPDGSWRIVN